MEIIIFHNVYVSIRTALKHGAEAYCLRRSSSRDTKGLPTVSTRHSYDIFRTWLWEIISIAVAVGLIVAIATLLATYNGRRTPDWGERINLNALLAILSTVLRAALVVVVSQIISQRKWDWFATTRRRPLSDLQQFDSGSRGSVGAIRLLPTVLWRDPVAFTAAIILFASFLVGPSVQQASRTIECTFVALDLNASLPFAHYVPGRGGYTPEWPAGSKGVPAKDLITAVLSAVTAPDGIENQIRGSCSTGNCTFPDGDPLDLEHDTAADGDSSTHSTVGVCNRCVDVAPLVSASDDGPGCQYRTLPNNMSVQTDGCGGAQLIAIRPNSDLSWMKDALTPELRTISRWAYVNASLLAFNYNWNDTGAAVMCSLYPCLRTYSSSITNNQLLETHLKSIVMQPDMKSRAGHAGELGVEHLDDLNALGAYKDDYTAVKSPCQVGGEIYDVTKNMSAFPNGTDVGLFDFTDYGGPQPERWSLDRMENITAPSTCIYRQHPEFVIAVSKLFNSEVFNGSCSFGRNTYCHMGGSSYDSYFQDLGASTVLRTLREDNHVSLSNVTRWFDSFADTMTAKFRTEYGTRYGDVKAKKTDSPLDEIQGLAWQNATCVSMRNGWLLLPILLTAITAILTIWTIAVNWRHRHNRPVWKDSILPLLFYAQYVVDQHDLIALSHGVNNNESEQNEPDDERGRRELLEIEMMKKISNKTDVTHRHLYSKGARATGCNIETPALNRQPWRRIWPRRRTRKDVSKNHLLKNQEQADTHEPPSPESIRLQEFQTVHNTQARDNAGARDDPGMQQDTAPSPLEAIQDGGRPSETTVPQLYLLRETHAFGQDTES